MAYRAGVAGYLVHFNEERPLGPLIATRPTRTTCESRFNQQVAGAH